MGYCVIFNDTIVADCSFYEDYLGASFPFGSYSHVFLDSEFITTSLTAGAAMTIISSHLLVDDRIIDQVVFSFFSSFSFHHRCSCKLIILIMIHVLIIDWAHDRQ